MDPHELRLVAEKGRIRPEVDGFLGIGVEEDAFSDAFRSLFFPEAGLLPPVLRWWSKSRHFVIFERPPTMHTVVYHNVKPGDLTKETREHVFELAMPWTAYALELADDCYPVAVFVFGLQHSLNSFADPLGTLPLPNHYSSGGLCLPQRDVTDIATTIADGCSAAYRVAWSSGFNLDLNEGIRHGINMRRPQALFGKIEGRVTPLKLYQAWESFSLDEVAAWQDWPLPTSLGFPYGLGTLITRFQSTESARTTLHPQFNLAMRLRAVLAQAQL